MNVHADLAADAILIEKDVAVPMRDGARLKADVFRPNDGTRVPALLNLGPYQKDKLWVPPDTLEEKPNPYMNWETVNPQWWVPQRLCRACASTAAAAASRPASASRGRSPRRSISTTPSNGRRRSPGATARSGSSGISYYAINQWFVANLQPPSLKAIIPWEGFADLYRDALFHGGILSVFMTNWFTAHLMHHVIGRASRIEPDRWQTNTMYHWLHNNLDSGAFATRRRSGTRSRCRCSRSATGPAWRCICAATPKPSCAPPPSTRSCASMPAAMCIRSTPRRAGAISSASSTTGSRASTTA